MIVSWTSWVRLTSAVLAFGTIGFLASCAIPPEYAEPLAGLEKKEGPFSPLTLGIVLSANTQKALEYLAEDTRLTRANPAVIDDQDPRAVFNGLHQILGNRFKNVVLVKSLDFLGPEPVDMVMVADVRILLGTFSGTRTSVDLAGVFMEPNQQVIDTIEAKGEATVPYPASHRRFKAALHAALADFAKNLDKSAKLTAFASSMLTRPHRPSLLAPLPAVVEPGQTQAPEIKAKTVEDRLRSLKELRDKNLITEEQYQQATKEVLKKLTE